MARECLPECEGIYYGTLVVDKQSLIKNTKFYKNVVGVDEKEVKLEAYEWPVPKRFKEDNTLWAYGYENEYAFFFKLGNEI